MCGITGIFEYRRSRGSVSSDLIVRMRDTLEHRGPDEAGLHVSADGRLGFGHRRLSIVDLEHGSQPMFGARGTCLVFNGEIYNYPDLRRRLERQGVRFETQCDSEVILHLYERHGRDCVDHLTGMFAFAIWDPDRSEVFFARDPVGEKPLYWADRNGVFVFASEPKALLEHPIVDRTVNEDALAPYLAHLITPGPETIYAGIFKLPAGHRGYCDRTGVTTERYRSVTSPRRLGEPIGDDDEACGNVRDLLEGSLERRMMSDVPVGVLLSGGIDSSVIALLIKDHAPGVASFTVGFPEHAAHDERREARWLAQRLGMPHHEVVLTEKDALDSLRALVHYGDEPLADPVCVPLYAVTKLARDNGVKVVLAGEGADELFWGYRGYRRVVERWRLYSTMLALPRPVRNLAVRTSSGARSPRRREQFAGIAAGRPNPIHMPVGLTQWQREQVLPASAYSGVGWRPGHPRADETSLETLALDTQEYEFEVRLPELLLMRIDRFSMANSVEARVPFLDPALVDYVYHLPLSAKVRGGVSKYSLRKAMRDLLPERIAQRPKQGFSAPTSEWFAAAHGDVLQRLLKEDALRMYFDTDRLSALIERSDARSWESGQILWPILNFGLWHKYWIEGEPFEDLLRT